MHDINNKETLFHLVTEGASVITPNNRLSAALLQEYFLYCNNKTVDKPQCIPYRAFLTQAFQRFKFQNPTQFHPVLLHDTQCQHLWRSIIKAQGEITFSEGLLKSIMEAWKHCEQWQISPENQTFHYTPQTRQFQQWWLLFNKHLARMNAVTEHQLIAYLLTADPALFNAPLIWACFDEFNPQQAALQQQVSRQGIAQYRYELPEQKCKAQVFAAKDTQDEYQQLIAWLQMKLEQGEPRIGVVIPNLEQESHYLQRILPQYFDSALFNISLGQPLSSFPIISHALLWLNLGYQPLNQHLGTLLLQSPYLGCAKKEFISRSHYLQDSPLLQKPLFSLATFTEHIRTYLPELAELLNNITPYPESASPQEWVHLFQQRLNTLGFPGDYGLSSENYQCHNRLNVLFDEFRQLSLISPQLNSQEALAALSLLMDNTIFQAQKSNAPIQICGLLEASGCEFNSLWVMGLTDQCLPQKPRLSAFIPPQMQRELYMPHSLPARELNFARQTLERLERGSADTVFSFSRFQGDTPNLPCSLIKNYAPFTPLPVYPEPEQASHLIAMEETYQVPLTPEESVSGGTALLANQAKCPFKAFAEHRLKAKPSLETIEGLDAKEKGIMIHKIMELLWRTLGDQSELLRLTLPELEEHTDRAIHETLTPFKELNPDLFSDFMQEIEYTRLKRLVLSFIDWEKARPPFTVAALEESYSINLAGLDFKVRVDRLDRVGNMKWVIDYKSSLPATKPWNEERPKEPQLLLYALLDSDINTLILMQLKTGKILCHGLSEEAHDIKGISSLKKNESWAQHRQQWLEQLTLLSTEFQTGHCLPQPASAVQCEQCDFQNLCRFQAD